VPEYHQTSKNFLLCISFCAFVLCLYFIFYIFYFCFGYVLYYRYFITKAGGEHSNSLHIYICFCRRSINIFILRFLLRYIEYFDPMRCTPTHPLEKSLHLSLQNILLGRPRHNTNGITGRRTIFSIDTKWIGQPGRER